MPEYVLVLLVALIGAAGGIGAFCLAWLSRREQRRLIAAQAEKTEVEADEIGISMALKSLKSQQEQIVWYGLEIDNLKTRIAELEADKRDRMAEMAQLYETLMSALAHNRYLEVDRARLLRFLRTRYPDVYQVYQAEFGQEANCAADDS